MSSPATERQPITEDWLRNNGFKWHQLDRQPDKHWLLWLGNALSDGGERRMFASYEDLGIELAPAWWKNRHGDEINSENGRTWYCWLRSDCAGRYHRFIHTRHLRFVDELVALIEALTGQKWDPANNYCGSMRTPKEMEWIRRDNERLDRRLLNETPSYRAWSEVEKDDTRGRALPEHLEAHEKAKQQGSKE